MTIEFTQESVMGLAPDAASQKAASKLVNVNKWATLAYSSVGVWGECKGSGSKPYQTRVDTTEIAFKCSCPSRKFPCKHGLALLLIFASNPSEFTETDAPAWVSEWLEGRQQRQQKKTVAKNKPVNVKQQQKRIVQREERVQAGIAELQTWLEDLIRHGLAQAQTQPYDFWEKMAMRLVDQQATGLANRVREMASICASGDNWLERLLEDIANLQLLIEANYHLASLAENVQQEVKSLTGWSQKKESLLQGTRHTGQWRVLGQRLEELDQVSSQRIWLQHTEGHFSYLLNFIHEMSPQTLDLSWVTGTQLELEWVSYGGVNPQRILERQRINSHKMTEPQGQETIKQALAVYKQAQQQNPWLIKCPLVLQQVVLCYQNDKLFIQDSEAETLPLHPSIPIWEWLAISGGKTVTLVAEWDELNLYPLGLWSQQHYHSVVTEVKT